jgi:hypothetical protein
MTRATISKPRLTGQGVGLTVPHMSQGQEGRLQGKTPLMLLIVVLTGLLGWTALPAWAAPVWAGLPAWTAGAGSQGADPAHRAEFAQADRLLPAGFAHIAPVDAPDQAELETLSEQLEDPLLAFGQPIVAFAASADAQTSAHGAGRAWAVRAPIFRSSSARGPPLI